MTDASVPVGDRNEEPAVRGPQLARQALGSTMPAQEFGEQVVALARNAGWSVMRPGHLGDVGYPHLVLVRERRVVAVWITSVPLGWQVDRWRARLTQAGWEAASWSPRDGLAAVEELLGPSGFDACGRPGSVDA